MTLLRERSPRFLALSREILKSRILQAFSARIRIRTLMGARQKAKRPSLVFRFIMHYLSDAVIIDKWILLQICMLLAHPFQHQL